MSKRISHAELEMQQLRIAARRHKTQDDTPSQRSHWLAYMTAFTLTVLGAYNFF